LKKKKEGIIIEKKRRESRRIINKKREISYLLNKKIKDTRIKESQNANLRKS
jgi:hypothetical protein